MVSHESLVSPNVDTRRRTSGARTLVMLSGGVSAGWWARPIRRSGGFRISARHLRQFVLGVTPTVINHVANTLLTQTARVGATVCRGQALAAGS